MSWPLFATIAFALDDDLVCVVGEPVEGALCEDRIVEKRYPFVNRSV